MVQQIASLKTESAASALPFTLSASALSVQNETRQTFNNELLRQSQPDNAPMQTRRTDIVNHANKQHDMALASQTASAKKQNAINEQAKDLAAEQGAKRPDGADSAVVRAPNSIHTPNHSKTQDNGANNTGTSFSTTDNNRGKTKKDTKSEENGLSKDVFKANNLPGEITDDGPAEIQAEYSSLKGDASTAKVGLNQQEGLQRSGEIVADEFDYIDYVTQIAEFTDTNTEEASLGNIPIDSELGILPIDKNKISDLPLINTHKTNSESTASLPSELQDELNANKSLVNIELRNNQLVTDNGALSVNISKEDLQKIIQIQQDQLGQGTDLSAQDQARLVQIVDDLIQQYEANNVDGSGIDEMSKADKELLASLLTEAPKPSLLAENMKDEQKLPVALVQGNQVTLTQTEKASDNQAFKNAHSATNSSVSDVRSIDTEIKNDVLQSGKENVDLKQFHVTASLDDPSKNTDLKFDKDDKKLSANALSLKNIAQLNDEQSKTALESLSSRVQAVVSGISGENKGSEFVAALQSGVKEFKQQLAQGREPGIDLKAIVAEALAQISGEATVNQQPKIDATLNQFSTVVNIANAINVSAIQHATQVLGVSDIQLAKEFTLGQIEGTKLANGIQNPSNVLSTTDKAINIFKQEGQQQLAEKVRWMVNSKSATAEIRLDPPDLGGINIKVNLSGDIAQVNFNVQSAAAKEALDQAVPRLREMLQDQGIELGESVVQQENQNSQQNETSENSDSLAHGNNVRQDDAQELVEQNTTHVLQQRVSGSVLGGIDYYA